MPRVPADHQNQVESVIATRQEQHVSKGSIAIIDDEGDHHFTSTICQTIAIPNPKTRLDCCLRPFSTGSLGEKLKPLELLGLSPSLLWLLGAAAIYIAFTPIDREFPRKARYKLAQTLFSHVSLDYWENLTSSYGDAIRKLLRGRFIKLRSTYIYFISPFRSFAVTVIASLFSAFIIFRADAQFFIALQKRFSTDPFFISFVGSHPFKLVFFTYANALIVNLMIDYISYTKTSYLILRQRLDKKPFKNLVVTLLLDFLITITIIWVVFFIYNVIVGVFIFYFYLEFPHSSTVDLLIIRDAIKDGPQFAFMAFRDWLSFIITDNQRYIRHDILIYHNNENIFLAIGDMLGRITNIFVILTSLFVSLVYVSLLLITLFIRSALPIIEKFNLVLPLLEPRRRPFRTIGIVGALMWLLVFWPVHFIAKLI